MTFSELLNMPIDVIHTLNYIIFTHRNDHKDLKEAEAVEDMLEETM